MPNNEQMIRELEETDPDELVELLRLTSEQLIKAFPAQVREYLEELKEAELEMEEIDEEDPPRNDPPFYGDSAEDEDVPW